MMHRAPLTCGGDGEAARVASSSRDPPSPPPSPDLDAQSSSSSSSSTPARLSAAPSPAACRACWPSRAHWLSELGLRAHAEEYASMLECAGLDPREAAVESDALARAGITDAVHARKLALASLVPARTPPRAAPRAGAEEGGEGAEAIDVTLIHALPTAARAALLVVHAWTGAVTQLGAGGEDDERGFNALALPIFATVRRAAAEAPDGNRSAPAERAFPPPQLSGSWPPGGGPSGGAPAGRRAAAGGAACGPALGRGGFTLRGDQYLPRVSRLRALGRSPEQVRLPADLPCCAVRRGVQLAPGSHAFVAVPGERHLRMSMRAEHFGGACGHSQLAGEGSVLFAGEVLLGEGGALLGWSNMSGTYQTPRELAAQVQLPLELLWTVVSPAELRAELRGAGGRACERDAPDSRALDGRYGIGNHLWVPGSESRALLVLDVARAAPRSREPRQRAPPREEEGGAAALSAPLLTPGVPLVRVSSAAAGLVSAATGGSAADGRTLQLPPRPALVATSSPPTLPPPGRTRRGSMPPSMR